MLSIRHSHGHSTSRYVGRWAGDLGEAFCTMSASRVDGAARYRLVGTASLDYLLNSWIPECAFRVTCKGRNSIPVLQLRGLVLDESKTPMPDTRLSLSDLSQLYGVQR